MEKKNNTEKIILVMIMVIGIVSGYFYYTSIGSSNIISPPKVVLNKTLAKIGSIDFDFSIFEKIGFKELRIFGESPVRPGTEGRADLFAPF